MGVPGWPLPAFSTASTESNRTVRTACSKGVICWVGERGLERARHDGRPKTNVPWRGDARGGCALARRGQPAQSISRPPRLRVEARRLRGAQSAEAAHRPLVFLEGPAEGVPAGAVRDEEQVVGLRGGEERLHRL